MEISSCSIFYTEIYYVKMYELETRIKCSINALQIVYRISKKVMRKNLFPAEELVEKLLKSLELIFHKESIWLLN